MTQREIKFRAWSPRAKRMYSAEEMAKDQMTLLPTGRFINVHSISVELSEIYSWDEMLPLQYTGLKDKNGIEIYEGDIVKYKKHTAKVSWNKLAAGFWFEGDIDFKDITIKGSEVEIIGNIYENKELIK